MISIHSLCPFLVFGLPMSWPIVAVVYEIYLTSEIYPTWVDLPRGKTAGKIFFAGVVTGVPMVKILKSGGISRKTWTEQLWFFGVWEDRRPETDTMSGWISWLVFVKSLLQARYLRDYGAQTGEIVPKWSGREPATSSRKKKNLGVLISSKEKKWREKNFFSRLSQGGDVLNFFSFGRK